MISAIREHAQRVDTTSQQTSFATADYLEACHYLFEEGILSHRLVTTRDDTVLKNMAKGFDYFQKWYQEACDTEGGQ